MKRLQEHILSDNLVQRVLSWWETRRWAGCSFHGKEGIEAAIRILCEKGLKSRHPAIRDALLILEEESDILTAGIGKPGKYLDDLGLGGSKMIRAVVFAYTGVEKHPFVKTQINSALEGFKFVIAVPYIEKIINKRAGKLVFKPGVVWPSLYHLRLLAFTKGWRTPDNHNIVVEAIKKLVSMSPLPQIYALVNSQLVAPASFGMLDFNPSMRLMSSASWMRWFQRLELLARLGVVRYVSELESQLQQLNQMLDNHGGWFKKKINHSSFRDWGVYNGLQLEEDWRSPKRRMYDLTFRSLLIDYYANQ
ncbi:MAG: hypothetical protein PVG14_06480 [Anaerolineales bacterium]